MNLRQRMQNTVNRVRGGARNLVSRITGRGGNARGTGGAKS